MDYTAFASLAVSLLVGWAVWSIRRVAESAQNRLETRVGRVEEALRHTVKPQEVASLRESLAELHGDIRALGAQIEALRKTTDTLCAAAARINDHLLRNSGRG
ncbi:MAG TPA: hypothetical protein ENI87_01770 [bacterium]|nr:hypothetical protein [bacterium]